TVIFVSHSMPSITGLCQRAILLDQGAVVADGPTHKVVSQYLNSGFGMGACREWRNSIHAPGADVVRLAAVRVCAADGSIVDSVDIRRPVRIAMEYDVIKPGFVLLPNFEFRDEHATLIFCSLDMDPEWQGRPRPSGRYISSVEIPGNLLSEGAIFVSAGCETVGPTIHQFYVSDVVGFNVIDNQHPDSARG